MRIIKAIKKWYQGQHLPHPPISSCQINIPIEQITKGYFRRPLVIRFLIFIKQFWIKHWQFLLMAIIAIIGIFVTLFIHFDTDSHP